MKKRLTFISIALFSIIVWIWIVFGEGYKTIEDVMHNAILLLAEPAEPEAYRDLAWSPDGQYVAVGGDTGLFVFDSMTLEKRHIWETNVYDVVWSRNDILVANEGNSMQFFSGDQFSIQISFSVDTLPYWEKYLLIETIEWSPAQDVLAAGLSNGTIQLFSVEVVDSAQLTIEPLMTLEGHTNFITSLDWNSNGTMLFSTSRDNTIKAWDIDTG